MLFVGGRIIFPIQWLHSACPIQVFNIILFCLRSDRQSTRPDLIVSPSFLTLIKTTKSALFVIDQTVCLILIENFYGQILH